MRDNRQANELRPISIEEKQPSFLRSTDKGISELIKLQLDAVKD